MNTGHIPFTPASHKTPAFNCPRCGAYADQRWGGAFELLPAHPGQQQPRPVPVQNVEFSICARCKEASVWWSGSLVVPDITTAPPPNPDMPSAIRTDYEEASNILSRSPRGAAALLRLAIQRLCIHFDEPGKNLNNDIASLVRKGLPSRVQQALDAVRVIGNEAVHPGQIDFSDTAEMAAALFGLVNFIVDRLISETKAIDEIYENLPPEKLAQIQERDGKPDD